MRNAFFDSKNAQIIKKGHIPWYFLILSNFCFMSNPKNASKYPKIALLKIAIFDEIAIFASRRHGNLLYHGPNQNGRVFANMKKEFRRSFLI